MQPKDLKDKIMLSKELSEQEKKYLVQRLGFGLHWEDRVSSIETLLDTHLPEVQIVPQLCLPHKQDVPEHLLVEGENLYSLLALSVQYREKVHVIYIDPPYNTENRDFSYQDTFASQRERDRHSSWVSFIFRRMLIAKSLLCESGVLFCSIGREEMTSLLGVCDRVFGEQNRLGIVSRVQKRGNDKGSFFKPSLDYVVVYAKEKSKVSAFKTPVPAEKFSKVESVGPRKGENTGHE